MRDFGKNRQLRQVNFSKPSQPQHPASRQRLQRTAGPSRDVDSIYAVARRLIVFVLLVGFVVGGSVVGYLAVKSLSAASNIIVSNERSGDHDFVSENSSGSDGLPIMNWENKKEPINILALGLDRRPREKPETSRTDTVMLISIDPEEKRASLISIPRDLQVTYEENGYKQYIRINAVHVYGYDDENKGSGAAAAKKAVSDLLGVPVHYFLRVDFMGFESLIDELGGVTVDVPHRLYDYQYPDENYGYEVVKIEPGVQVMDGKVALQYARSRHAIDAGQASDLSRAERQQAVMMAVKEKAIASKWNLVSNPTRLAGLLDTLKDNVLTDIQLEEMVELAKLAKQIDTSNPRKVASMVLGPPLIYHEDRPGNGWRYYLADTSGEELRQAVADFLVDPFLKEDIVLEEATVRLENGTTQTGIASEIGLSLRQNYGITTESPVNADRKDYDQTVIRDLSNGQASRTVEFLERYFGVESYVPSEIFPGETADVVVVLGQDQTEGQKNAGTP